MEKKKKMERRSAVERARFSQRTEEGSGMGLEWNADGCRISRWRRISLATALTRCKSALLYLPTPESSQVRFPDSPIQHTSEKTTYLSTIRVLVGFRQPSSYKRTARGCPPRMGSVSPPLYPQDPDSGPPCAPPQITPPTPLHALQSDPSFLFRPFFCNFLTEVPWHPGLP